ncbi:hypothetical protein [Bifidobacterium sp. ESL0745]|uniref:hypothetical protein n=1 Tax=Bifidobacterium sp. ESL0745 TaxID=2983226 RepID=UPI0023F88958|nr:hypothetical protein [Bifidobacterium sp. ESL0745]MDF7666123.1 hypothetical protein [Bifidobacterium sp. ESL0745]
MSAFPLALEPFAPVELGFTLLELVLALLVTLPALGRRLAFGCCGVGLTLAELALTVLLATLALVDPAFPFLFLLVKLLCPFIGGAVAQDTVEIVGRLLGLTLVEPCRLLFEVFLLAAVVVGLLVEVPLALVDGLGQRLAPLAGVGVVDGVAGQIFQGDAFHLGAFAGLPLRPCGMQVAFAVLVLLVNVFEAKLVEAFADRDLTLGAALVACRDRDEVEVCMGGAVYPCRSAVVVFSEKTRPDAIARSPASAHRRPAWSCVPRSPHSIRARSRG